MRRADAATIVGAALVLTCCAGNGPVGDDARCGGGMSAGESFVPISFDTSSFVVCGSVRQAARQPDALVVYIEGDGDAWTGRFEPARDPTPRDSVVLRLAQADLSQAVLYLARPCQYSRGAARRGCDVRLWTSHRYGAEAVAATQQAIDDAKARLGAREIELVGYSGGGVIATLVAARRGDVRLLVTIAANLDPAAWTRHHRVSAMADAESPVDSIDRLSGVRQLHLQGDGDEVVPPRVTARFVSRLPTVPWISVRPIAGFDHRCCWAERWPQLIAEARALPPAARAGSSSSRTDEREVLAAGKDDRDLGHAMSPGQFGHRVAHE